MIGNRPSSTAALVGAAGNITAGTLLLCIAECCFNKKVAVPHDGRPWVRRTQQQRIESIGLKDRTGKRAWKSLVEKDLILVERRPTVLEGIRVSVMHVALTDKTYAALEGTDAPEVFKWASKWSRSLARLQAVARETAS